jgi:DNA invertase Pin-like site-specific DNA recombinase
MNKIIFSYCRVSSSEQSTDGIGLDIQQNKINDSIKLLMSSDSELVRGDDVIEVESAFKGNNLDQVVKDVELDKYPHGSIIVLYDQSRFSRKLSFDVVHRMRQLVKAGLFIHLATKGITYDNLDLFEQFIMPLLEAEQSHKDSAIKSERTAGSYQTRLSTGINNYGGHTPNWIKRVYDDKGKPSDYELIPDRVNTINKIYQLYIDGKGANAIVRYLNENVKPWSEHDGRRTTLIKNWGESYISKILQNPSTIGHRTFNKTNEHELKTITDYYKPAITKELFYKAQDIRKSRGKTQTHITKHPSIIYIGVTYCGYCGSKMIAQNFKDKKAAVRCAGHSKGETLNCAGGSHPARFLEKVIIELCKDEVNFDEIFNQSNNELDLLKANASELIESISNIENQLTRLEDLYLDGDITKERYLERKLSIPDDLPLLKEQLQSTKSNIDAMTHHSPKEDTEEFVELLNQVSIDDIPQEKRLKLRDLLKKFISRIDVYRYGMMYKIDGSKNRENLTYGIKFKAGAFRVIHFSQKLKTYTHGIGDDFVLNNIKPKSTDELIEWLTKGK